MREPVFSAAPPVVFVVPTTFNLDDAARLRDQIEAVPEHQQVDLDFGAVLVCHAFVFAGLLSSIAARHRLGEVRLLNLNPQQTKLVSYVNRGRSPAARASND